MARKKSAGLETAGTLTIRVTPKLRFAIELLAQVQKRSLSSVVVEAVQAHLRAKETELMVLRDVGEEPVFLPDECWDPLEPDRFVKLARAKEVVLTDRQATIWKVIKEDKASYWDRTEPIVENIRADWDNIERKADALLKKHGGRD